MELTRIKSRPSPRCRSIVLIPEAKESRTVPPGPCDRKGDFGEAIIGLAVPGEPVSHHHHPLRLSIPLPDQDCAGFQFGPLGTPSAQRAPELRFRGLHFFAGTIPAFVLKFPVGRGPSLPPAPAPKSP